MSGPLYQNYTIQTVPGPVPRVVVQPPITVSADHASACQRQLRALCAAGRATVELSRAGTVASVMRAAVEALMAAWDDAGILRRPLVKVVKGRVEYAAPPGAAMLVLEEGQ